MKSTRLSDAQSRAPVPFYDLTQERLPAAGAATGTGSAPGRGLVGHFSAHVLARTARCAPARRNQKCPCLGQVHIAKSRLLLSRGHRADLATTRPKRFELWPGSRALLSFKTVYNTFENRRMHQCWWGGCGHVMALHSMPAEWANGFGSGCARSWRQSH